MMTNRRYYGSAASLAMLLASSAFAQTAGQPVGPQVDGAAPTTAAEATQLQDIVVTARKTVENNQKAPATIVAVSGSELQQRGITDIQALEKILPSANLRTQGSVTQVYIRGIGTRTDLPNFATAAAFVYNGVIIQRYGTSRLTFDLNRVESIAGPQGTLYGGSAAGGAIDLFSERPHDDYAGYARLELGNYSAVRVNAAQDVPLNEFVSVRGAVSYNSRGSYYSSGLFTESNYSARLSALIKPTSNLTANIFYTHVLDNGRPVTTALNNPLVFPSDPWRVPATGLSGNVIDGRFTRQHNQNDIIGANVEFSLGDNEFIYIPAYVGFTADYSFYNGGNGGNQLQVYDRERQHSEELRWNRRLGKLQLSGGLFYLRNLTSFDDSIIRFPTPTTSSRTVANVTEQENLGYAVYGQAVFSITDRLRLTGGGRFSRDKIVANGKGAGGVPIAFDRAQTRPDYKAGVDFDAAEHVLAYANFQSGYIPFGYNPDVAPTPVVPESKLTSYSGGVKSQFFDRRVELNIEGYYYIYKNFQAIQFVPATGLSTVLNAAKSTILGVDISGRALITPTTQLDGGIVLQRARYDNFSGIGYNYSGNQLQNAPDLNIQAGLQQTVHLGGTGNVVARADTHYESGHFGTFNNFPNTRQPAYTKTDLSVTYSPPSDRWSIQGFVRNVENTPVFTTLSAGATIAAPGSSGLEAPRTFGILLSAKWG